MAKGIYKMKTTSGKEVTYTYPEMMDIVKQHLKNKYPDTYITEQDCLAEVDRFVARFKLIDNKEELTD